MATHNFSMAASADDAQEAGGTMSLDGVTIAITSTTRYGGFSFDTSAAPIAQAATITAATFQYTTAGSASPNLTGKGHKVTNSAQFAAGSNNISNRYSGDPTTASVTETGSGIPGGTQRDIDVTAIVQELVNQAGWTSSSRITLLFKGETGTSVQMRAWNNGSLWATLVVTVAEGGAMPKVARVRLSTKVGGLLCSI